MAPGAVSSSLVTRPLSPIRSCMSSSLWWAHCGPGVGLGHRRYLNASCTAQPHRPGPPVWGGGEVHQGVFHKGNFLRGSRVTAQVSEKNASRITDEKGRHDRGSCLPFWRGRLKSIFGIDRTVAEESPNRPFDRRRFCAVQAFAQAKTLAQGEFTSPEHFNH